MVPIVPVLLAWCLVSIQAAVLDPALYLAPSPPLTPTSDSLTPEERWLEPLEARIERDANLNVVPLDKSDDNDKYEQEVVENAETTVPQVAPPRQREEQPEPIEKSSSFWPGQQYGGIHIPLTFSISGNYGRYGGDSALLGSSYASAFTDGLGFGNYGKSGYAGSSYSGLNQGIRIYGNGGGGPAWSGWGNGKWGHYGKG